MRRLHRIDSRRASLPTRPRRCLKYVAVTAAVLFVLNYFWHLGYLLPIQAIRAFEQREGIDGHTSVIQRRHVPELGGSFLLYLTGNEKATALGSAKLNLYGWMEHFGSSLDCTENAPFYIGEHMAGRSAGGDEYFRGMWYYGRVDAPSVERIEVSIRYADYDEAAQKPVFPEAYRLVTQREEWLQKDGQTYFLIEKKPFDWPHQSGLYPVAYAYDSDGKLLHEIDIGDRMMSIHGL